MNYQLVSDKIKGCVARVDSSCDCVCNPSCKYTNFYCQYIIYMAICKYVARYNCVVAIQNIYPGFKARSLVSHFSVTHSGR